MNISEHLKKDYWVRRVTPDSVGSYPPVGNHIGYRTPKTGTFGVGYVNLTQDQFLNELNPAAHEINSAPNLSGRQGRERKDQVCP